MSIMALGLKECAGKNEFETACAKAKADLNVGGAEPGMQYDVMLPGGKTVGGLIPWTAKYNQAH